MAQKGKRPEDKNKRYNFSIPPDIKKRFDLECFMNGKSMSEVLSKFMDTYATASKIKRFAKGEII